MFKNRVQISRLSGVDGLVCDAGDLELDALVNWRPVPLLDILWSERVFSLTKPCAFCRINMTITKSVILKVC